MKTCRRVRNWIDRSFDGSLGLEQEFLLEEHLVQCPRCRDLHESSERLRAELLELPAPPEERLDIERSLDAIHAAVDEPAANARPPLDLERSWEWHRHIPLAAAGLIAALAIGWVLRGAVAPNQDAQREIEGLVIDRTEREQELGVPTSDELVATPEQVATPELLGDRRSTPPALVSPSLISPALVSPALVSPALAAVVIYPLLPESMTSTDLDHARLEDAQNAVRSHLARAGQEHLPADGPDAVLAFTERFDQLAAPDLSGDWPVELLVARFVDDDDPLVARAAARYVGTHVTRRGIQRLLDALDRPDCKLTATLALADAGELGFPGLARAFWDPQLSPLVRSNMALRAADRPQEVVAWVREALTQGRRRRVSTPETQGLAAGLSDLLGRCGPAGAELLIELGVRPAREPLLRDDLLIEALAAAEGAQDVVLAALDKRPDRRREEFLLHAVERLRPAEAYAWVLDRAWYGHDRGAAAHVLVGFAGTQPLAALLELSDTSRLSPDQAISAWRAAVDSHPDRLLDTAWEHVNQLDRLASRRLLDWLVLSERTAVVPAVLVLVEAAELPDETRERALLAVGELGVPEQAGDLLRLFTRFTARERELAAACLLSLHRLGGAEAVRQVLAQSPDRTRERVLDLLAAERPGGGPAVTLFQLSHALAPVLRNREPDPWRSAQ